jgi:hypothetical protein
MHPRIKEMLHTCSIRDGSARPVQRLNAFSNRRNTKCILQIETLFRLFGDIPVARRHPSVGHGAPADKNLRDIVKQLRASYARIRNHRTAGWEAILEYMSDGFLVSFRTCIPHF